MILQLKIKPNARKNEILYDHGGNLKVKVKAPPVDGKANRELIVFLSLVFGVPRSHIGILSGETSSHKKIEIFGDEEMLKTKLQTIKH